MAAEENNWTVNPWMIQDAEQLSQAYREAFKQALNKGVIMSSQQVSNFYVAPRTAIPDELASAIGMKMPKTAAAGAVPVSDPGLTPRYTIEDAANIEYPVGWVEPPWFDKAIYGIQHGHGLALFGPKGSSKTTVARLIAKLFAKKDDAGNYIPNLVTVQCHADLNVDDLRGQTMPKIAADGSRGYEFIYGPAAAAFKMSMDHPDVPIFLHLEESNTARTAVKSWFNTATDGSGTEFVLPDGTMLRAGKNLKVVALFNPNYAGTRAENTALLDRLVPIYADYLPPESEVPMLKAHTDAPEHIIQLAVGVANAVRAGQAEHGFDFSPRSIMQWVQWYRFMKKKQPSYTLRKAFEIVLDKIGAPNGIERQARDAVDQVAQGAMSHEDFNA